MNGSSPDAPLQNRFNRLHKLLAAWEKEQRNLENHVLECFFCNDLSGIRQHMATKKRLARRIQRIQAFLQKWETASAQDASPDA